jgi:thiamine pyrophosphate-dependent acetolactate synthase large subunit-like protein
MTPAPRMPLTEAVAVVHQTRRDDDVVISSMGNAREWMAMGPLHPRDFVFVPSAMGHATCVGLGLALAQPKRRIIVLSGDGSLLMNLGTLVTMAAYAPANLTVVVFDNGVYEVTGAQPTPGTIAAGVDFTTVARGCGLTSIHRWASLDDWRRGAEEALAARGPTLVVLDVAPKPGAGGPRSPGPTAERAKRFKEALRVID